VPLPLPVIVIHEALLVDVQAHPALVVTVMGAPAPPAAVAVAAAGAIEYVQVGGAAAWVTVKVCPAIVRLPVRSPPVFAAAV
jgi:hypothetical protein